MDQGDADTLPAGTAWLDAFVFDVNGRARGKRLPARVWPSLRRHGLAFSGSALLLDATGATHGIGGADGDPDAIAHPVPGTLGPVPWAAAPTMQTLLSMPDHAATDARAALARIEARLCDDGLIPVVACELEFYIVRVDRRGRPHAGLRGHLDPGAVERETAFLHALHAALTAQGIAAGMVVGEYGPGQFEVNLPHHADAVRAADEACLLRRAAEGVAIAAGKRITFMAKPFAAHAGSGLHLHVNLLDREGRNLFADPAILNRAAAGKQALYPGSMAAFAPNFAAYRRLAGGFVARTASLGHNRRDAMLRIPLAGPPRIEHRAAAADASPHLALAAILAGAHWGVTQNLPNIATAAPPDWFAALAAWESAPVVRDYLGTDLVEAYAALRRAEAETLFADISDKEYEYYL